MRIPPLTIALISLIPSIGICIFVYFKDKKEKEPLWLLASLFAVSAALYVPVYYLGNKLINGFIGVLFKGSRYFDARQGVVWRDAVSQNVHNALCAVIGVALIEELTRWLILYFFTNRSRHFNCTFDGVVYSIMVSMGALVARNVRFAFETTWDQFLLRFAHSFPWYLLFGIVMGVFYSYWHASKRANRRENELISEGKLKKDKLRYPAGKLILSIAVPVILHAVYTFVAEQLDFSSRTLNIVFYAIAAAMMIVSVLLVVLLSRRDTTERAAIERIIEKEHGDLPDEYYEPLEEDSGESADSGAENAEKEKNGDE
ncbi:MAG: PrsW family intramembrane metalloprotease [Clostridia bacterium]|nr:PrsW family intramembrane metalloprotease [Clostridia bacterium]MBR3416705.1 PrsW family intramembrane metalloprotease [Clostridia bacterium]